MNRNPKVSIIMPAYNGAPVIKSSIDAILGQTLSDLELIVIDDGSTDNTAEVVAQIKDPRIKLLKKKNSGQAAARNMGIKQANGSYISYCDQDDKFLQNHLEVLAGYLDSHPKTGLVYSKTVRIKSDGGIVGEVGEQFSKKKLEFNDQLIYPVMEMHRKECLEKAGYWDEDQAIRFCGPDWDLHLRISDFYKIDFVDQATTHKLHDLGSLFFKGVRNQEYFSSVSKVLIKRVKTLASRKTAKIAVPFGGYYFHHFSYLINTAKFGEKEFGVYKASDVVFSKIIPAFEELSLIDPANLEVYLVLLTLYAMQKQFENFLQVIDKAVPLLDQKFDSFEEQHKHLLVSSLKVSVLILKNLKKDELMDKFSKKLAEIF